MQIYISKEKSTEMFKYKEHDGRCTIITEDGVERDGFIVGISTNGSYFVELFEETTNENRKL